MRHHHRRVPAAWRTALGSAALVLTLGAANAGAATLAPLNGVGEPDAIAGRYVVVMKDGASAASAERAKSSARAKGGSVDRTFTDALRGFAAELQPAALEEVRGDPDVAYVEADSTMSLSTTQPDPTWGLDRIDQTRLPLNHAYTYIPDGTGVQAFVIDGGMRFSHEEFGGRARSGYDFVDNDDDATDTCRGHGTHVAGIIGGTKYGVAKRVGIVAVRVMNCAGTGRTSDIIAGIDWTTNRHMAGAPAVANMSLSGSPSTSLDQAVRNSIADGITYVLSAGNTSGDACGRSPARVAEALTVSATNASDERPSWANVGPCVDLFAPGEDVTSAGIDSDTSVSTRSGTSMAAPHVAGVAATYLQTHPRATPSMVQAVIRDNATAGVVTNPGAGSPNLLLFSRLGAQMAFAANSGRLGTTGWAGYGNLARPLMPGTSPAITALSADTYQIAFQADTSALWTMGSAGTQNWGLGMMAGTSPDITALSGGGFQVAFQANTGELWSVGPAGNGSLGLRMAPGTSPSITALPRNRYEVAFQADTGQLWTAGSAGTGSLGFQMAPGTSPSITTMPGGTYEVAYQHGKGDLRIAGAAGTQSLGLGMMAGTSPSITTLPQTGDSRTYRYEVAFQANTGVLWVAGTAGTGSQGASMPAGTSPSITTLPSGRYDIAFQSGTGVLRSLGGGGDYNWGLSMNLGTSPSIAGL